MVSLFSFLILYKKVDYKKYILSDAEFTYLEIGGGSPMVVLHGLFGAFSNFEGVINHFSKRYRVIMPMLPIYTQPIVTAGIKYLTRFVAKFIKHLKLEDFLLVGNSLGGHLGLSYCSLHLGKSKAMVLTGSSGLYENAFGGSFPKRSDKKYLREKIALTFYDPEIVTDDLVDELAELISSRANLYRILAVAKSAIRHNMESQLKDINIPVCLIWGKNDNITPPHVAENFNDKLPDSDLFWIDKTGHAPMMERPQEFNKILDTWLAERKIS